MNLKQKKTLLGALVLLILVEAVVLGALVVSSNLPFSNSETLFSSKSLGSRKLMAETKTKSAAQQQQTSTSSPDVEGGDKPKLSGEIPKLPIFVLRQGESTLPVAVELSRDSTVADLYTAAGVGIDEQLTFQGQPLTDRALLLSEVGISAEAFVHVSMAIMQIYIRKTPRGGRCVQCGPGIGVEPSVVELPYGRGGSDFEFETRVVELPCNALVKDLYAKAGSEWKILLDYCNQPLKDPKQRLTETGLETGHTVRVFEIRWKKNLLDELKPIFEVTLLVPDGEVTVFVQWTGKPNRSNFRFVEKTLSQTWIRAPTGQHNAFRIYLRDLSDDPERFFQRIGSDTLRLPSVMRLDDGIMIARLNKVVYWDGTEIQ